MDPLIDSHCHLDDPRYSETASRLRVLDDAARASVHEIIVPGVAPEGWEGLLELVKKGHPRIRLHACLGIHPQVVPKLDDNQVADSLIDIRRLARQDVVAIGECGLDGPTARVRRGDIKRQLEILEAQLHIADELGLPAVVHCFRAHEPLRALLKRRGGIHAGFVLHSYSGSAEQVAFYLEQGAWFSFAGPITYHNAKCPVLAARAVPLDRLLVETDAPDQTPEPYRNHLNEPAFIVAVVEALARARGIGPEVVARASTENARRCFKLPPCPSMK